MDPNAVPDSFEVGTIASHLIMSFAEGVRWVTNETAQKIHQKESVLLERLLNGLKSVDNIKIYGTQDLKKKTAVVSFYIEKSVPSEVSM